MPERKHVVFATFFPSCENIHLTKDVGMIPYVLHRDFGYDSRLICYENGEYPYLKTEVPGLELQYIRCQLPSLKRLLKYLGGCPRLTSSLKLLSLLIDALPVILRFGKEIDVLQLYHLKPESVLIGIAYRMVNRRGVLQLKLDMNSHVIEYYDKHPHERRNKYPIRRRIFNLASFDIVSVESKAMCNFIREVYPFLKGFEKKLYYIPNGIDASKLPSSPKGYGDKENIILHSGRIGLYQKGSEIILKAFADICNDFPGWRLVMTGQMEEPFFNYFRDFLGEHEDIADRIAYLGFLKPRELYDQYYRAKILAMPSRFESFGLLAVEAGAFGDIILGSDLPSLRDITNDGKYGYLCPIDDIDCFTENLRIMLSNEAELSKKSGLIAHFIRSRFDWTKICDNLNCIILDGLRKRRNSDVEI
ncbi:D-inositol-3-phosphate glycosyltransferase [uncultured archaeon]|nr:D-inositol-3-phosphate glycosyltransferase [uncultured archaeon]